MNRVAIARSTATLFRSNMLVSVVGTYRRINPITSCGKAVRGIGPRVFCASVFVQHVTASFTTRKKNSTSGFRLRGFGGRSKFSCGSGLCGRGGRGRNGLICFRSNRSLQRVFPPKRRINGERFSGALTCSA